LTPEQLLSYVNTPAPKLAELRKTLHLPAARNGDTGGYVMLDLLQSFLTHGKVEIKRTYKATGNIIARTTVIPETSKKYRKFLYASVQSFFIHNRAALPRDKWRVPESAARTGRVKPTYMPLVEGRNIIGACKTPYKELFSMMLYSGMGVSELLSLNDAAMWARVRKQLADGKDPVRMDFAYRKNNPKPYFTFAPAPLLKPFSGLDAPAFKTNRARGKPITEDDLRSAWKFARLRAGVDRRVTPHQFRDLLHTEGLTETRLEKHYVDFLTGHVVDPLQYTQLYEKPGRVLEAWSKWRTYLDEGPSVATKEELTARDQTIQHLQQQIDELRKGSMGPLTREDVRRMIQQEYAAKKRT
jgi:integrase